MQDRYKIVISSKNIYKEIDLLPSVPEIRIGTETECEIRLSKSLFFEKVELYFSQKNGQWSVFCSDNLYLDTGDLRKLLTIQLKHGDAFSLKYQNSDNEVFSVEFLIDFDNGQRKYERAIDVSSCNSLTIGSDNSNNIVLRSQYTKSDLIELNRSNNGFVLNVKRTSFGVYHNGTKVNGRCILGNGDFFSVSDFIFYFKDQLIWTEIRNELYINNLPFGDYPNQNNYPEFSRNTRIHFSVNDEKIEILDPPTKPEKPKNNLLMTLLPSVGMLVASGAMAFVGGTTMIIFSAISGGMAIVTAILSLIQSNKDYKKDSEERIAKYNAYIQKKRSEIKNYRDEERARLNNIYIDAEKEQELLYSFSGNLFDRISTDEDFLKVRLGIGKVEAIRKIDYKKQERLDAEDDLQEIPERISEEEKLLLDAPIVCDFKNANGIGIVGSETNRFAILKNIVFDICTRHYHTDVKMFFVACESNKSRIDWLRFLPHVYNEIMGTRNIVCDDDSKNRIYDYLYKELVQREQGKNDGSSIIVFFYDEYGFKSHPISKFIDKAKEYNVTFVFFAENKNDIPQGCNAIIQLDKSNHGFLVQSADFNDIIEFTYNAIDDSVAQNAVSLLAPVYTEEISLESTLTKNISLFELLNIIDVDDLDLSKRWGDSKVFQSMSAPIGVAKSGIIELDLHDKAHGPHGLVAGTTGSGKSEILQTYILSIATLFHPFEVSFVIIDFKGGGMVNQFKNLPHLLGSITNIDGKEIDRSLKSIKAELQKRQKLFAEAEVNHIDKYIKKFKAGEVKTPIPHLIVIVDEFAELKAEQPEFMKELISAARIGRSLGVHLILATQKPSGQVDEQIWSNSRFKLCLKVQSQEDSNEVLKSPLAAEIKEPGRAYLQVGNNEVFELFQSAYSGAPEKMEGGNIKEFSIFAFNESGRKVPIYIQKKKKSSSDNLTQLEAIVEYVNSYCTGENIQKLPNICLPSLPDKLDYLCNCNENKMVDIGLYDDPDNQYQGSSYVDIDNKNTLIIGSSQYGKTNLLQSMIRTISTTNSVNQANIYIIDFGSMVLKNFESLNHVGGVVCSSEDEKLKNLFKLLFAEISTRKEKLVSVGVSSFSSYLEAGYTDLPHIYLFIDNLTALVELYLQDDDSLLTIVREGLSVGISTIIANPQTNGIGYRYLSNFANKIALYCNDANEYGNLFDHVVLKPDEKPGRCVVEIDKRILECQTYLAFEGEKEIDRVNEMHKFISEINRNNANSFARSIPFIPTVLTKKSIIDDYATHKDAYKLPIALTYNDVAPYYLDLSQLGLLGLCGKEGTGHKNFISYILSYLEEDKLKNPAKVAIFDDISRKYSDLKELSIVENYTLDVNSIESVLKEWYEILQKRYDELIVDGSGSNNAELLLLIIQNNDVAKRINDDMDLMSMFSDMTSRFKGMNFAVIFTNFANASVSYDAPEPIRMIKQDQHLLYFEDLDNFKPFDIPYEDIKANRKKLETGDAYYIQDNVITKLKMIMFEKE